MSLYVWYTEGKEEEWTEKVAGEGKIWQIQSRSAVKAVFFPLSSYCKNFSNPLPCHVKNLTPPDTQGQLQNFCSPGEKELTILSTFEELSALAHIFAQANPDKKHFEEEAMAKQRTELVRCGYTCKRPHTHGA